MYRSRNRRSAGRNDTCRGHPYCTPAVCRSTSGTSVFHLYILVISFLSGKQAAVIHIVRQSRQLQPLAYPSSESSRRFAQLRKFQQPSELTVPPGEPEHHFHRRYIDSGIRSFAYRSVRQQQEPYMVLEACDSIILSASFHLQPVQMGQEDPAEGIRGRKEKLS